MIVDGSKASRADCSIIAEFLPDFVVVGAGTSGCTLTAKLLESGHRVLLLEYGGLDPFKSASKAADVVQTARIYRGVSEGRAFGLGGTSGLWGGQMLQMTPFDFRERLDGRIAGWPLNYEELQPFYRSASNWLDLDNNSELDDQVESPFPSESWSPRFSSWIRHARRNIGKFLRPEFERNKLVLLVTHVDLQDLVVTSNPSPGVIGVRFKVGVHEIQVRSVFTILCCGALETTRLLMSFRKRNSLLGFSSPALGKFFSDHLSVRYAKLLFQRSDRKLINLKLMSRFERGVMRTPRFELTPKAQQELKVSNTYAHFLMVSPSGSGFDLVRKILRRLQGIKEPLNFKLKDIWLGLSDVMCMVYWRYVHNRLYLPPLADLYLQVDIEQIPQEDSKLDVSEQEGLIVNWQISDKDFESAERVGDLFLDDLARSELGSKVKVQKLFNRAERADGNFYDVFHPTGTLRMGDSPDHSVVDKNLKIWGLDGLYVNTTAVFPSSGAANPGLTHFALTFRLAQHLSDLVASATGQKKA